MDTGDCLVAAAQLDEAGDDGGHLSSVVTNYPVSPSPVGGGGPAPRLVVGKGGGGGEPVEAGEGLVLSPGGDIHLMCTLQLQIHDYREESDLQ